MEEISTVQQYVVLTRYRSDLPQFDTTDDRAGALTLPFSLIQTI